MMLPSFQTTASVPHRFGGQPCPPEVEAEWDLLCRDSELFLPAVKEIGRRHGVPVDRVERFARGSTPVFRLGEDVVLKLYAPFWQADCEAERDSLIAIEGRLPTASPSVIAAGDVEGWPYLLMSWLEGALLADVWPSLPEAEKAALVEQLGETLRALHDVPSPASLHVDWDSFLEGRLEQTREQQRRRGLNEALLAQIEPYLERNAGLVSRLSRPVLLHTEPTGWALLAGKAGELTGILDFADAMTGDPEYDFVSVGLFVTRGDRALFGRFLAAYGVADPALSTRLMVLTLLHRYCHLRWYLSMNPVASSSPTLEQLADAWFGC